MSAVNKVMKRVANHKKSELVVGREENSTFPRPLKNEN